MRIFTRSRDAAEYIQQLEAMVVTMAEDISNLTKTCEYIYPYTVKEIIDNYAFVTSEPSILEESLYKNYGTPYLKRESTLAYLMRTGVVLMDTLYQLKEIKNDSI